MTCSLYLEHEAIAYSLHVQLVGLQLQLVVDTYSLQLQLVTMLTVQSYSLQSIAAALIEKRWHAVYTQSLELQLVVYTRSLELQLTVHTYYLDSCSYSLQFTRPVCNYRLCAIAVAHGPQLIVQTRSTIKVNNSSHSPYTGYNYGLQLQLTVYSYSFQSIAIPWSICL